MDSGQMNGGPKELKNCVRVLEDVNRKEKVVKSKVLESAILGRCTLQGMISSMLWLRQIIRGEEAKTPRGQVTEWILRS